MCSARFRIKLYDIISRTRKQACGVIFCGKNREDCAYNGFMDLSFNDLKKREVVNVADGSNFGHIVDMELSFPKGKLTAIIVPARRGGGFWGLFERGKMRIEENNIIKIGGDAILVNVKCGDACASSVNINPLCPPPRPAPCPPPCGGCPPPFPPDPPPRAEAPDPRIDYTDY